MKKNIINPHIFLNNKKDTDIKNFYEIDLESLNSKLKTSPALYWEKLGEKMTLSLFKNMSQKVPAYKLFLKKNKINPKSITKIADLEKIPYIDKKNYLKKYPLEKLCWNGEIENNSIFSVSSGSSGSPFFWPRGDNLELETSLTHALFLQEIYKANKESTLLIDSFSMGIYIAGVITLNSVLRYSQMNMPISIITTGIETDEILRVIKELGNKYKQIILAGYPPFIKDVLEEGKKRKIKWEKYNIKFLFATESISEQFREYIFKTVGAKDYYYSSLNIYGSADAGILGHETPISIHVRSMAYKNKNIFKELWGDNVFAPTFVQYNPVHKFFQKYNNELLFSAYGGLPLLRYNIHDSGNITPFNEAVKILRIQNNPKTKELLKNSWKLPFVSVLGRSDLSISFYGLMLYPENIKSALEDKEIIKQVTGKFMMQKIENKKQESGWEIFIELSRDVKPKNDLNKKIGNIILKNLLDNNLEYKQLYSSIKEKAIPSVHLIPHGNNAYFNKDAVKQKWVNS